MKMYLVAYGADNEFWSCMADDADHAVEQFVNAEMVSPFENENLASVTAVYVCTPVEFDAG